MAHKSDHNYCNINIKENQLSTEKVKTRKLCFNSSDEESQNVTWKHQPENNAHMQAPETMQTSLAPFPANKFSDFFKKYPLVSEKKLIFDKIEHRKTSDTENVKAKLNLPNSSENQSPKKLKKSFKYDRRKEEIVSKSPKKLEHTYKYATPNRSLDEFLEQKSKKLDDKLLSNRLSFSPYPNLNDADVNLEKGNISMENEASDTNSSGEKSGLASTKSINVSPVQTEIDSDETNVLIKSPNCALVCKEKSKNVSRENTGTSKLNAFYLQHSGKFSQLLRLNEANKNDKCNKKWEQLSAKESVFKLGIGNAYKTTVQRKLSEELSVTFRKQKSEAVRSNASSQQFLGEIGSNFFDKEKHLVSQNKAKESMQQRHDRLLKDINISPPKTKNIQIDSLDTTVYDQSQNVFSDINKKRRKSTSSDDTIRRKYYPQEIGNSSILSDFSDESSSDDQTHSIAKGDCLQRMKTNVLSLPDKINFARRFSNTIKHRKLPSSKAFRGNQELAWKFKEKKIRRVNRTSSDSSSSDSSSKMNGCIKNMDKKNWNQFSRKRPSSIVSGNKCSGHNKASSKDFNNPRRTQLDEIKMRCMNTFIEHNSCFTREIRNIQETNTSFQQELQENVLNPASRAVSKSQRNLLSSEGFHESMSYETPTITNSKVQGTSEEGICHLTKFGSLSNEKRITEKSTQHLNKPFHNYTYTISNLEKIKKIDPNKKINSSASVNGNCDWIFGNFEKNIENHSNKSDEENYGITWLNQNTQSNDAFPKQTSSSKILTNTTFQPAKVQGNDEKKGVFNIKSSDSTQINAGIGRKILQSNKVSNGSFSDRSWFGSPLISYANDHKSKTDSNQQVFKVGPGNIGGGLTQRNTSGNFKTRDSHLTTISSENRKNMNMVTCPPNLGDSQNSLTVQKNNKLDTQILQNLYRIHESNNWDTQSLSQKEQSSVFSPDLFPPDTTIDQNKKGNVKSGNGNKARILKNVTPHSSQSNWVTGNNSDFMLRNAAFLRNFGNSHTNANNLRTKPDNIQTDTCDELNSSHTNDCYTQTNYEEESCFSQINETLNQTQNSVLTNLNTTKNTTRRSRKAFNLTEDCILYEDNLLKELLEEKTNIKKTYNKNKLKRKISEESDVLAKTYIKRYRKNNTKIFKIRRRLKKRTVENYVPPEDQIMDKFINRVNNGFNEDTSSESEECDSISTPPSYRTDHTKWESLSTGSRKLTEHQQHLRLGINKLSKDNNLLFSRFSDSAPSEVERTELLGHVQKIICDTLEAYEQGGRPYFMVPRADSSNCVFEDNRFQLRKQHEYKIVTSKYPFKRARFNLMLFILNKIRLLLESGTKLTKREIFYQLKAMISSQSVTDNVIADISKMLKVGVWALNITAQKGLVFGNLKLVMKNGETINCNVPGTLVPKDVSEICEIQSDAYFILVVEKESVFHKLLEENLPSRLTRPFILITGKGFPDLSTQLFLKKLWMIMCVPVFILVDADPDGIAIMLNYRFGSMANAHVSEQLAIPKARWIGVFPSEIFKLSLSGDDLSKRDIAKTQKLLQLQCVQENEKLKRELETLLKNGIKTGIEALMKTDTYLSHRYLSLKFYMNDLI